MRIVTLAVSAFALALGLAACSTETGLDQSSANEALKGGCRMVCPKCTPNMGVCPMYACMLDCNGKPATCVETMMCPIGYAWNSNACSCEPAPQN
jgi:hypothetical protein